MPYNYRVAVGGPRKVVRVVVGSLSAAVKLAARNLIKNREVGIFPTKEETTHRSAEAAHAYVEVKLMMEDLFKDERPVTATPAPH